MKKIFFLFLLISFSSVGQTVLLDVDKASELRISETGQNLKKFTHMFLRFGLVSGEDKPGARVEYEGSVNIALGVRKKFKIGSVYSLGFEIETQFTDYKLKQGKILPDTNINNISGRMDYYSLGLGFYNRFNFDPDRGNFIGTYLDIGAIYQWDFSVKEISKNELPDGTISRTSVKNLGYTKDFSAKIYSRIGFGHFALYGSYRITDLFKTSSQFPDLPRLILGVEFGLY